MTETPDPAAVQIAAKALRHGMPMPHAGTSDARRVVDALARRYALVEHAGLAALRAVADAAHVVIADQALPDSPTMCELAATLDALPTADEKWNRPGWAAADLVIAAYQSELERNGGDQDRAREVAVRAVTGGPQPADETS